MFLKRLELAGFKSFASQTEFSFDQKLTAIVGPNGSGKSNLADALRWVLGEQKQSLLRGKAAQDVIFAGSDKRARLGSAEVVATFDNNDRRMPIDAPEVSISRRADRSGNSTYFINGAPVRMQDVAELVLKSGIGAAKSAVVGQGTVDQLIAAGPAELKLLLDEVSGVRVYYVKREKTLRRLEQTDSNLLLAEDRLSGIEPRLKLLRRQVTRYEQRAGLKAELEALQKEYFGIRAHDLKIGMQNLMERLALQDAARQSASSKLLEAENQKNNFMADDSLRRNSWQNLHEQESQLNLQKQAWLEKRAIAETHLKILSEQGSTNNVNSITEQYDIEKLQLELADLEMQVSSRPATTREKTPDGRPIEIASALDKLKTIFLQFCVELKHCENLEEAKKLDNKFTPIFESLIERINKLIILEIDTPLAHHKSAAALEAEISRLKATIQEAQNRKNLQKSDNEHKHTLQYWQQELATATTEMQRLSELGDEIQKQIQKELKQEDEKRAVLQNMEHQLTQARSALEQIQAINSPMLAEKIRLETLQEQLRLETQNALGGQIEENIQTIDGARKQEILEKWPKRISSIQHQLESIGQVDELLLQEHQETEAGFNELSIQISDLRKAQVDLKISLKELDQQITKTFQHAFTNIQDKFKHYFSLLFNGGKAELILMHETLTAESETDENSRKQTHPNKPEALSISGVDIKATPPGKKLAAVTALSGGERALTAIALLCAMLDCFPAPVVILDEADAALDEANTVRFGQIISALSKQTQFITVTHNRETMARADIIYGITMDNSGTSKVLSIRLNEATEYAK